MMLQQPVTIRMWQGIGMLFATGFAFGMIVSNIARALGF